MHCHYMVVDVDDVDCWEKMSHECPMEERSISPRNESNIDPAEQRLVDKYLFTFSQVVIVLST